MSTDTKIKIISWSLFYDSVTVLGINFCFLILLNLIKQFKNRIVIQILGIANFIINSFIVFINIVDVFYYKFHLQRLNADVRFVISNSFQVFIHQSYYIIIALFIIFSAVAVLYFFLHKIFYLRFYNGNRATLTTVLLTLIFFFIAINKETTIKRLIPTYPLLNISNKQLPAVQNSFHTLIYSLFREQHYVPTREYFSSKECDSMLPIVKSPDDSSTNTKRNIVLFIMESVAYDFFDSSNMYKVKMPFFDSLIKKSYFFNNAYSFGIESNKGIVSILAGQPTLTDIPLYHSAFTNMPITQIGKKIAKNGYNSFFCIGDQYDNFGFAKCMNWLGIDKYYCLDDIVADKSKPMHSMGMQDEYVLNFFHQKIKETKEPFFAIQYNISTHYPFDIPSNFKSNFPENYTPGMKAMSYYDNCLKSFFNTSTKENWFQNTIFIFCSDHWMYPNESEKNFNNRNSFRIPIIIYDPLIKVGKVENRITSQFDILGTILHITQNKEKFISYGNNLMDIDNNQNFAVTKMNNNLYQILDSTFILGYDIRDDTAKYMYEYLKDKSLEKNLLANENFLQNRKILEKKIKVFFQQTSRQFNNKL